MPGHTPTSRDRPELVDGVARDEVNNIAMETDLSIAHTLSPQLVEFGFLHPLATLGRGESGLVGGYMAAPRDCHGVE